MTEERVEIAGGWAHLVGWVVRSFKNPDACMSPGPWNEFTTDRNCWWTGTRSEAQNIAERLNIEALAKKGKKILKDPPPYYASEHPDIKRKG